MGDTPEQTSTRQVQARFSATVDVERVWKVWRKVAIDAIKERLGYDGTLRKLMPVSKVCAGCGVWRGKATATP
jgi:hypothetical protein